jgi:hypothetical protein
MMLTVLKGPISYDDIKKVAGIQLKTFREACFAMGFLGDDKEFIGAIKEASHWGTGRVLRFLFVTLLLSATMDRPAYVWKHTLKWLSDGILYAQRRIANNPGIYLLILNSIYKCTFEQIATDNNKKSHYFININRAATQ